MIFSFGKKKADTAGQVDFSRLPRHIAIILDGNGRWAKRRGLPRTAGHKVGAETFRAIATYCRDIGIDYLTVYAFSTENWKRPQEEVDTIMALLKRYLLEAIETMERIVPEIGAREFIVDEDIAKVSLVGTGMKSSPGVASRTFQTLGDNNINIMAISTSPIRLSMIVDAAQAVQAVQCLHTAFGLDSDDLFVETQLSAEEIAAKMKKGR